MEQLYQLLRLEHARKPLERFRARPAHQRMGIARQGISKHVPKHKRKAFVEPSRVYPLRHQHVNLFHGPGGIMTGNPLHHGDDDSLGPKAQERLDLLDRPSRSLQVQNLLEQDQPIPERTLRPQGDTAEHLGGQRNPFLFLSHAR